MEKLSGGVEMPSIGVALGDLGVVGVVGLPNRKF